MDFLHAIFGPDFGAASLIVLNLVIIESLLSVDNAAVLATMVMDLPKQQQARALRIGLILAYIFRGLCLLLASFLMKLAWLKGLGGAYLIYLCIHYFMTSHTPDPTDDTLHTEKKESVLYRSTIGRLGKFWSTVLLVELMDLTFSLDNVFAAVAYVENYGTQYLEAPYNYTMTQVSNMRLYLVWLGVFIGILTMRIAAVGFVKLMNKFPFLATSAFIVIGVLGVKLLLSAVCHYFHLEAIEQFMEDNRDKYTSVVTVGIFVVPILTSLFFGFPKRTIESDTPR